jgi:hypothetical protein
MAVAHAAVAHAETAVGRARSSKHKIRGANSNAMAAVRNMIGDLLAEGARTGDIRDDVAPGELATYCLHALTAASSLPSKAAVRRLVEVTLAGLHPRPI